jgi:hypothetical protein
MFANSWSNRLPRLLYGSQAKRPGCSFRPRLQCLEDRLVPSTLIVNTHQDLASSSPGILSLREAIATANQDTTADTIVLGTGLYTLSLGELTVTNFMTIEGQGAGITTVDGATLNRIFQVNGTGVGPPPPGIVSNIIIQPPPLLSVTFADMSLRHGNGTMGGVTGQVGGGAIQGFFADLNVVDCQVSDNTALNGGGINDSSGDVTLTGTTVSRNTSQTGGGGINVFSGTVTLKNSVVRVNSTPGNGGGILTSGTASLSGSALIGNSAGNLGGGMEALKTTLTNSTVSDNFAAAGYGGILATGTLTLTGCIVSDNRADAGVGGIGGDTTVTLNNTTITGNQAVGSGGGILGTGAVTANDTTISDNSAAGASGNGGGIYAQTATFTGCTITGNSAGGSGGGIYIVTNPNGDGPVTLTGCTLSDNSAGGAGGGLINSFGLATVINSTISDNYAYAGGVGSIDSSTDAGGGGIEAYSLILYASTVKGNVTPADGGGIWSQTANLTNSTISGNSAGGGGGIWIGDGQFLFDTIAENTATHGGGVYAFGGGTLGTESSFIEDCIVGLNLNSFGGAGPDLYGFRVSSFGNNLIGILDSTSTNFQPTTGDQVGNPAHPLEPGLTGLGNHGGPTQTYALLSDSKAIGAGVNVALDSLGAAATAQDTTLTVKNTASNNLLPFVPGMPVLLDSEVVLVKTVSINADTITLTVQRGIDGTQPAAHILGTGLLIAADQRGVPRPSTGKLDIGAFEPLQIIAVGADLGHAPEVKVYDAATGALRLDFDAYEPTFMGGVRVAVADMNGDGIPDIITAPGGVQVTLVNVNGALVPSFNFAAGRAPQIKVFSGLNGSLLDDFLAYPSTFTAGVFVAVADVNGDGKPDIIAAPDATGLSGHTNVRVFFNNHLINTGAALTPDLEFNAYNPRFGGGVRIAATDLNHDGFADIITAPGIWSGPDVRIFDGQTLVNSGTASMIGEFDAYNPLYFGGVFVSAGDVNGDGVPDIVTGTNGNGGPEAKAFSGTSVLGNPTPTIVDDFFAYAPAFNGGARLAVLDLSGDAEIITGAGPGGSPQVRIFGGGTGTQLTGNTIDNFNAFEATFSGGVYVGAG